MFSSQNSQVSSDANYIEDVFQTWLYTGNGSTQTITNGIDLAGKGGLTWIKRRDAAGNNFLFDTQRGALNTLFTDDTSSQVSFANSLTSFNSGGFSLGTYANTNGSARTFASWTFRKQPKFFDVVTWTGNGVLGRQISHSLGSVPGSIIVKCTSNVVEWVVYHRFDGTTAKIAKLNTTAAAFDNNASWFGNGSVAVSPTSSVFTVADDPALNNTGYTYVAYLFAHNAGGFGLTGTDNVISCGSYTGNGSATGPTVTLGYEPQWLLTKRTDLSADWQLVDTMRGMSSAYNRLFPNSSAVEDFESDGVTPTATGFKLTGVQPTHNASGGTYIYIAIRRGPMKVPTSGTSVLGLNARSGTSANATVTGGAGVTDLAIIKRRNSTSDWVWTPRLTGTGYLSSNLTASETAAATTILQANPWDVMDGIKVGTSSTLTNNNTATYINYLLDRAPSFMDVVCYTGAGGATSTNTKNHNLGVAPELIFIKNRGYNITNWLVWCAYMDGTFNPINKLYVVLDGASGSNSSNYWSYNGNPQMTSTLFSVGSTYDAVNNPSYNYIAYLFASCPGVSKVGRYSGNGSTQTINCGFTGGARFVLIKNTTTGNAESWHIFDTARGMVAGTDPRIRPNTTDSENTGNWVYTATTGFEIVTSDAAVNSTGNNYIFLAIA